MTDFFSHAVAFFLPLCLFAYFFILGYPLARFFISAEKKEVLAYSDVIFASPVMGFGLLVCVVFTLNFTFNLPVKSFGVYANIVLLVFSLGMMLWKRDFPRIRPYARYFIVLFFALILVGYPLLKYGFGWLSFANDDMTNYCLGAVRFFNHGFTEPPDMTLLLTGKDYSLLYWFLHVSAFTRAGSELLLAWFYAVLHLNPQKMFMVLSVASHLMLLFTSVLLIRSGDSKKRIMLLLLLAVCANLTLGLDYQLIAQVGGMAIMVFTLVQLFRWVDKVVYREALEIKSTCLLGFCFVALLIYYPELTPFVCIPAFLYYVTRFWHKKKQGLFVFFQAVAMIGITLAITSNRYMLFSYHTLVNQLQVGMSVQYTELFSYFLVPNGFSAIWGISTLNSSANPILAGIRFFIAVAFAGWMFFSAVKLLWRKNLSAYVFVMMLVIGFLLFAHNNGFGLFKLVMYAQPFIWVLFVESLFFFVTSMGIAFLSFAVIFILQFANQTAYVIGSLGLYAGSYAQIYDGSKLQVIAKFEKLAKRLILANSSAVFLDTNNLPLLKLQLLYLRSLKVFDVSRLVVLYFTAAQPDYLFLSTIFDENVKQLRKTNEVYRKEEFIFYEKSRNEKLKNIFHSNENGYPIPNGAKIIFSGPQFNIFNRIKFMPGELFKVLNVDEAKNFLIFIESSLGQDYYLGDPPANIGLNQLQMDYFYPKATVSALGKYLLLRVVNPSSDASLLMDVTATLNPGAHTSLPEICIIGKTTQCLQATGNGSARMLIPLPAPRIIQGVPYVLVAVSGATRQYFVKQYGPLAWYGKAIHLDYRHFTLYARDISLVDSHEMNDALEQLDRFPEDLKNNHLLYSGYYEDGWVGQDSIIRLNGKGKNAVLLDFLLPKSNDKTTRFNVAIDGVDIYSNTLLPDHYHLTLPIKLLHGNLHWISLHFSHAQVLSEKDRRVAAAKINSIGFVSI